MMLENIKFLASALFIGLTFLIPNGSLHAQATKPVAREIRIPAIQYTGDSGVVKYTSETLVAAIYHFGARKPLPPQTPVSERPPLHKIIFALFSDGRVIWSKDPVIGGPPYQTALISKEKISRTLTDLHGWDLFDNPSMWLWMIILDSSLNVIYVRDGHQFINLESCHELFEDDERLVCKSSGVSSLGNENRLDVLSADKKEYILKRMIWSETKCKLLGLVLDCQTSATAISGLSFSFAWIKE